jgi:prepilin signal peptidase PulO-like enzyme (type II secretory pathway)
MDDGFTQNLAFLQAGLKALWIVFAFAFGASAGSLINVLVYRLPRGLDVIWTGSQCPCCETKLTWRENIPVFGWLALGGRCRFCKSKISAEYPLVELLVGLLWAGMFLVYYALPEHATFCGVDWTSIRPEWANWDANFDGWPRTTWPMFIVHLFLVASLVAMTLVDAKTFTIPLVLPWAAMLVGIAFHTLGAVLVTRTYPFHLGSVAPGASWGIATPNWLSLSHTSGTAWWWIGASMGGTLGIVLANAILHLKLIRRSFEDYPDWERAALKAQGIDPDAPAGDGVDEGIPVGEHVGPGVRLVLVFVGFWLICLLGLGYVGRLLGPGLSKPRWAGLAVGFLIGPFVAAVACRFMAPPMPAAPEPATGPSETVSPPAAAEPSAPDMWIAYPHARREMFKELIFLTPVIALGWLGGFLAQRLCSAQVPSLWLLVLCGTLMGVLIGGGIIWGIRIFGSLGFGKEAMGLGDVHMMAAVGACLGWPDAGLAVPLAALVGLGFVIVSILAGRPAGKAMPFGPYLAVGTLIVMFAKPLIEQGLTYLISGGATIIPSVNLP